MTKKYNEKEEKRVYENQRRFIAYALSYQTEGPRDSYLTEDKKYLSKMPKEEIKRIIKVSLESLKEMERNLLNLKYGLNGLSSFSAGEIARVYKKSKGEIKVIEKNAIEKVRPILECLVSL